MNKTLTLFHYDEYDHNGDYAYNYDSDYYDDYDLDYKDDDDNYCTYWYHY